MRDRQRGNSIAFLDLLFNMLIGFFVLFVISFLMINTTDKDADTKKPKAEFLITLSWDKDSQDDVDIWVEDPLKNVLYFQNKEVGLMHLDRDDLGRTKDVIMIDGRRIEYRFNQEIVTIRGFISGEWTVNVHLYRKTTGKPETIIVRIDKLNPEVKLLMHKEIVLTRHWEEKTVTRFTMTNSGSTLNWNDLDRKLVLSRLSTYTPTVAPPSDRE